MKKVLFFLLLFVLSFSMNGCKSNTKDESQDTLAQTKDTDSKYTASTDGVVQKFTGDKLTILTNDKREITFSTADAELDLENGIETGNDVTVIYTGRIKNTDTSETKVVKLVVTESNTDDTLIVQPTPISELDDFENVMKKDAPDIDTEVEEVNETVSVISSVNYRTEPQKDSEILGYVETGDSVKRTGICKNGWSRVSIDGETAFIWGEYLS